MPSSKRSSPLPNRKALLTRSSPIAPAEMPFLQYPADNPTAVRSHKADHRDPRVSHVLHLISLHDLSRLLRVKRHGVSPHVLQEETFLSNHSTSADRVSGAEWTKWTKWSLAAVSLLTSGTPFRTPWRCSLLVSPPFAIRAVR
jgi:hypothetical protein